MTKDMTEGALLPELIGFTIPLVLGNLLQLTYNAADSIIVGRYVGKEALAAIGTTNPLMTLVLLFTNGICIGAGILVGYLYGAKEIRRLRKQVSTGMLSGLLFSVAVGLLMICFSRQILTVLQVDASIMKGSAAYLRIIMCGMAFSFVYNYLASVLRAMGDSRSPLYFLAISASLNIAGDLFFVVVLRLGITGAAVSTVLCEALSSILCWIYVQKRVPELRLKREWLILDKKLLRQTISYGIVSALQQSTLQIGKLCTQGIVNSMGVTVTAAFNATNRFDDYAMIPEQNIGHAMSCVMVQNRGGGKPDRVNRSFRLGMVMEMIYGCAIGLLLYVFANPLMSMFTKDASVILEGEKYLHTIALLYPLPAITNGMQGYFRGMGDLKVTLYSTIANMIGRTGSCFLFVLYFHMGFEAVPWSYLCGWILMILFELPILWQWQKKNVRSTKTVV